MRDSLIPLLICGPLVLGFLAWIIKSPQLRKFLVVVAALLTAFCGIELFLVGPFQWSWPLAGELSYLAEFLMVLLVVFLGFWVKSWTVIILGAGQLGLAIAEELTSRGAARSTVADFVVDPLAHVMVLIVSIVGSCLVIYAIGYMRQHKEHAPRTAASDGRFFFFLVGFLGLMNGLVLTDNLRLLSVFWEGTTLCSFFLIGHDGTPEARRNARLALIVNTIGGAALASASFIFTSLTGEVTVHALIAKAPLLPLALIVLATLTKSAQMPFQSWLLGAMVAPTPVSALLHSSTMVKAGSYLILRVSPAYCDTALAPIVAIAGAFTFAAASALAISQSNGKRVLAYSTIANLGLIVTCASLNSPLAYASGIFILVFHAVSKALLFLCVGTVEQTIGSRQIEDMSGILYKMPLTTSIAVVGMVSMMAPPFGMLIGKWMAIEASVNHPLVLIFIVIGSALTVFFWAKWIGRITTASYHDTYQVEKIPNSMRNVLIGLVAGVVVTSFSAILVFFYLIRPVLSGLFAPASVEKLSHFLYLNIYIFMQWPIFIMVGLVFVLLLFTSKNFKKSHLRLPFLCGENVEATDMSYAFHSLMDKKVVAYAASFYFIPIFGESNLTKWANAVAFLIVLSLFASIGVI